MYNFGKKTKVLIIDRGWLEEKSLYEESFLNYFEIYLNRCIDKICPKIKVSVHLQVISIMKEISDRKIFDFVDDKDKVKKLRIDAYNQLDKELPHYMERFSTDVIKRTVTKLNTLYVFIVYTESQKEIEMLHKKYSVKGILKFNEKPKEYEDNFKRIYINSISKSIKVARELPLLLFQDITEIKTLII